MPFDAKKHPCAATGAVEADVRRIGTAGSWLRQHPVYASYTAGVLLVGLALAFAPANGNHWNVLVEAWGAFGAGAVVWYILEQRSEAVQRRAWLPRHSNLVRQVLMPILRASSMTVAEIIGGNNNVGYELRNAPSRHERLRAAACARRFFTELHVLQKHAGLESEERDRILGRMHDYYQAVRNAREDNGEIFALLKDLLEAVVMYEVCYREFEIGVELARQSQWDMSFVHPELAGLGFAASALCVACNNVLHEAGVLR